MAGKPQKVPKPPTYTPPDYLSGSKTIGQKYNAWDTYGQGRPDFGAGPGPGDPYHVVQKTVRKSPKLPPWAGGGQVPQPGGSIPSQSPTFQLPRWANRGVNSGDAKVDAIRRRLGWA